MKKVFLLMLVCLFFITGCSKNYAKKFEKMHVGLDEETAYKIMGEPDDYEDLKNFHFAYWFEGAKSQEDASNKVKDGESIKYYCAVFYAADEKNYIIMNEEDFFSGYWGEAQ